MPQERQPVYCFGRFRLDAGERMLLLDEKPVPLTPKMFDMLLFLIENRGRLLEKARFMEQLWPDTFVEEVTLASNISELRKVLGEGEDGHKYIQTVPKSGYRFVADVGVVDFMARPQVKPASQNEDLPGRASPPPESRRDTTTRRRSKVELGWRTASVSLGFAALILAVAFFQGSPEEVRIIRFDVPPPEKADLGTSSPPSISPDGRHLAFVALTERRTELWVRELDSLVARKVITAEGLQRPFWSPDGRYIAFFSGGKLKKVSLTGGSAVDVCDV